ncbi:hypothetical protein [Leptobacterium sp. I13]|uniref:hypothetical protein n=1 Tax=Leptobacterium meishanense TaxID=3128904 RepID=UPI0030EE0DB2
MKLLKKTTLVNALLTIVLYLLLEYFLYTNTKVFLPMISRIAGLVLLFFSITIAYFILNEKIKYLTVISGILIIMGAYALLSIFFDEGGFTMEVLYPISFIALLSVVFFLKTPGQKKIWGLLVIFVLNIMLLANCIDVFYDKGLQININF